MNAYFLPQEQLEKISSEFYGQDWNNFSEKEKQAIYSNYRKAEQETNEQIKNYGSVEKWYASGEGRVLLF